MGTTLREKGVSMISIDHALKHQIENGEICAGCGEPFALSRKRPTLCSFCFRRTPVAERGPYLKADRRTEESVIRAKANHAKRTD